MQLGTSRSQKRRTFGGFIPSRKRIRTAKKGVNRVVGMPQKGVQRAGTNVFLWSAIASVIGSVVLRLTGRKNDAVFVGEWAPTFLLLGVLGRMRRGLRRT